MSPASPTYLVVLHGLSQEIPEGFTKQKLANLFRTDVPAIDRLLQQLPYSVKSGVDQSTAARYKLALEQCGCVVSVEKDVLDFDLPVNQTLASQGTEAPGRTNMFGEEDSSPDLMKLWKEKGPLKTIGIVLGASSAALVALVAVSAVGLFGVIAWNRHRSDANPAPVSVAGPSTATPRTALSDAIGTPTPDEQTLINRVRARVTNSVLPTSHDLYPGVTLTIQANQYGESPRCQIDFTATKEDDGKVLPPNWSLSYLLGAGDKVASLTVNSFYGTNAPLRMRFDGMADYLPMNIAGETGAAVAPVAGQWLSRLKTANRLEIDQGIGASGRLTFVYDLTHFESVRRIAQSLCGGR